MSPIRHYIFVVLRSTYCIQTNRESGKLFKVVLMKEKDKPLLTAVEIDFSRYDL